MKRKIVDIHALLMGANLAMSIWAFASFPVYSVLLGTTFLACCFSFHRVPDWRPIQVVANALDRNFQDIGLAETTGIGVEDTPTGVHKLKSDLRVIPTSCKTGEELVDITTAIPAV